MGGRLNDLLIRDVEIDGRRCDVRIADGSIAEIGPGLDRGGAELDGRGGALIPGLVDHHIHLLATAAARASVSLEDVVGPAELAGRLRVPGDGWLRATGFHEHRGGALDRKTLDRIAPGRPVRVQHQTGSVWFLNSVALGRLDLADAPPGVDPVTGRIERADDWLRRQVGQIVPDIAPIARELATAGVTGITDASVTNDEASAALFADAQASGALPQKVMMMSGAPITRHQDDMLRIGPVKILLDDHNLPPLDAIVARIAEARRQRRRVAVHCVTAGELALTLAAFEEAGSLPGDRIEHGGVIPEASIAVVAALGLTVVTQSAFPCKRGDRYLAEVERHEQGDLYRCASLIAAGIAVAGSSDGPYATIDPWAAMRAAVSRRTVSGRPIGVEEAIAPARALGLYLGSFADPGGARRPIAVGAPADLCLLHGPIDAALTALSRDCVAATIVAGRLVHHAEI
jgi:predicted amidohydrolase YtcJ